MVKDTYVRMRRVGFVDSFDPSKSVQAIHIYIYMHSPIDLWVGPCGYMWAQVVTGDRKE